MFIYCIFPNSALVKILYLMNKSKNLAAKLIDVILFCHAICIIAKTTINDYNALFKIDIVYTHPNIINRLSKL